MALQPNPTNLSRVFSTKSFNFDSAEKILEIENQITIAQNNITTIQNDISTINSDISVFESDISTIETNLTNAQNNITTIENDVSGLTSDVSGLTSSLATTNNNVSTNTNSINSLTSSLSTTNNNVSTNTNNINSLTSSLSTTDNNVSTNTTNINGNTNSINTLNNLLTGYSYTTGTSTNRFNQSTTTVSKFAVPYFYVNSNSTGYAGSDFMTFQLVQSFSSGASSSAINVMYVPNGYSVLLSATFCGNDATNPGNNSLFITFQNAGFATNATFPNGRYGKTVTPIVSIVNYTGSQLGSTTCSLSIVSQNIVITINSGTTFGIGIIGKWTFTCSAFNTAA